MKQDCTVMHGQKIHPINQFCIKAPLVPNAAVKKTGKS
jgi:hypothetical protein